jgi:hypothetical protein
MSIPRNKPNLFIVGAAKAGTTALRKNLSGHPDIYFSPIKEPHYFSTDISVADFREEFGQDVALDLEKYLKKRPLPEHHQAFLRESSHYNELFREVDDQPVVAEASASYLWSTKAATNIYSYNPQSKIIILLRNPVDRAFSHYLMDFRMGYTDLSFKEALLADNRPTNRYWGNAHLYTDLGLYAAQVKRYLDVFPSQQLLLIWHKEFTEDVEATSKRVFDFLDLDSHGVDLGQRHNVARVPRNKLVKALVNNPIAKKVKKQPWLNLALRSFSGLMTNKVELTTITPTEREFAYSFFEKDILILEVLLGVNLDHWKLN